ncbi:MAG: nucleotidyltransferase family protein [Bradymonadales bacterium]|nr:nucleotidyltransferase family protein [Bradymonadales bacterium]
MSCRLTIDHETLASFCTRHGIKRLSLFGSLLKGTARPDRDIDILVEFDSSARPTLLDLAAMEEELSCLLGGRRVDVRTPGELSRHFRDEVMQQAEVQYAARGSHSSGAMIMPRAELGFRSVRTFSHGV